MISSNFLAILACMVLVNKSSAYNLKQFIANPWSVLDLFQLKHEQQIALPALNQSKKLELANKYNYGCSCENYECICCSHLTIGIFDFNNTSCLKIVYSKENSVFDLEFSLDEKIIYNNSVPVVNNSLPCFKVPIYETGQLCLKLNEIKSNINESLSGCSNLLVKLGTEDLVETKLGCFNFSDVYFKEEKLMKIYATRTDQQYFYEKLNSLKKSGNKLLELIREKIV